MESSYRIIKRNHIKSSSDQFVVDTNTENAANAINLFNENIEEYIEEALKPKERLEILKNIEEYKKKVNFQIESERKNILEMARIDAEKAAIGIREAARQEGYTRGYDEGYASALEEARDEAELIKEKSLDLLKEARKSSDIYLKENEENIYKLAKTMAENIIDYVIDIDDENILLILRPLLYEYLKEDDIIITSNKEGKHLLEKHRDKIEEICPNTRLVFLVDKSMEKNGFVIENKEGIVDLQIGLQLENMLKAISDMDE